LEKKSTFITVISWLYIVIFGIITLMTLLQFSMLLSFTNNQADSFSGVNPSFTIINWEINPVFAYVGLIAINIVIVMSSILLLLRKNVGRIIISIYNCLLSIFLVLQQFLGKSKFAETFSSDPTLGNMYNTMKIGMAIFSTVVISILIFIIYMINRKSVRGDFTKESIEMSGDAV
jgi:hypothetical protein